MIILTNAYVTFRKGPSRICRIENLSEFTELAWIWESSLWQSHSNRTPSVHLQDRIGPSLSDLWQTPAGHRPNALPICRISGWPRALNAINLAGHLWVGAGPSWMHVPWKSLYFWSGFGRGAKEVQNHWKSLQLFNSNWKCDMEWAIPKFSQRSRNCHFDGHVWVSSNCSAKMLQNEQHKLKLSRVGYKLKQGRQHTQKNIICNTQKWKHGGTLPPLFWDFGLDLWFRTSCSWTIWSWTINIWRNILSQICSII